jgi:hypothetical protein
MRCGGLCRALLLLAVLSTGCVAASAADDVARFEGFSLLAPSGYDEWPLVGASLGLSYSRDALAASPSETFHRVYLNPSSYRAFLRTGSFPEGSTFVLELYEPAGMLSLPARAGKYEGRRVAVEASVKDTNRFGGWGYFGLDNGRARTSTAFDASRCQACHVKHAATDSVFTQFYPRLRDVNVGQSQGGD